VLVDVSDVVEMNVFLLESTESRYLGSLHVANGIIKEEHIVIEVMLLLFHTDTKVECIHGVLL
jgi:hypothetical protein